MNLSSLEAKTKVTEVQLIAGNKVFVSQCENHYEVLPKITDKYEVDVR